MKIDSDECLTIYPVGIRESASWVLPRTPWADDAEPKTSDDPGESWFVPSQDRWPEPELIDNPIRVEVDEDRSRVRC